MLIDQARIFALVAHAGQKYGELPYVDHLHAVVAVLTRYGFSSPITIAAAYLHDVLEDAPVLLSALAEFPTEVVRTVLDVTNEPGKNRAERFAATYPKIAGNERAVVVKLADRIANVEHSVKHPERDHFGMYRKEYPGFRAALYSTNPKVAPMWKRLDELLGSA